MPGLVKSQADITKRKTNHSRSSKKHSTTLILVFVQVKHQVDLLDLGKHRRIKFQIKELFINMYFSGFICVKPVKSKNRKAVVIE